VPTDVCATRWRIQFAQEQVQVLEAQAQLEQARAEMLRQQINATGHYRTLEP
jgi:hypothetical protein